MTPIHSVCIIGTGNIAWHWIQWLQSSSTHTLIQVVGRRPDAYIELGISSGIYIHHFEDIICQADLYILCVSDKAIPLLAHHLTPYLPDTSVLLHCSGSVTAAVLSSASSQYGVVWPVQSLLKYRRQDISTIPCVITASSTSVYDLLSTFLEDLHVDEILQASDHHRQKMHLSAVVSNNFIYFILKELSFYLEKEDINPTFLQPIIQNTVHNAFSSYVPLAQTGPARRHDLDTIHRHLNLLDDHPELRQIYDTISQLIISKYNNTNT